MSILKSGFQVFLAAYLLLHPKTDIIYGIYASCIPRRAIKSTHWDPPPPVWCVGVAASCPGATSQSHVLRLEVVDLWQLNEGKFVQIFFLEKIFRSCLKQISGSAPEIYFFPMILKLSKKSWPDWLWKTAVALWRLQPHKGKNIPKYQRSSGQMITSHNFSLPAKPNPIWSMYGRPTFTTKNQPNVGKYTSPMDPMGIEPSIWDHEVFGCPRNPLPLQASEDHTARWGRRSVPRN